MGTEPKNQVSLIEQRRNDVEKMKPEFAKILPSHTTPEQFTRIVMNALQMNSDLLKCTPKSFLEACMRAAVDGLVPDNREGAIVPYGEVAQWLPMVWGLKKKLFQSGLIEGIDVEVVRENDEFDYERGTNAFVRHRKPMGKTSPGEIIGVFSVVTMKTGHKTYEVMSLWEVEEVRKKSRGKNTPWNDAVSYPEMVKKTCIRRHSKNLPLSKEDRQEFERVTEDVADYEAEAPVPAAARPRPRPSEYTDAEVVIEEAKPAAEKKPEPEEKKQEAAPKAEPAKAQEEQQPAHDPQTGELFEQKELGAPEAMQMGRDHFSKGLALESFPKEWAQMKRDGLIEAFKDGWLDEKSSKADAEKPKQAQGKR